MNPMIDITPYIFKIQRFSIHDGPGIRTTLFFQGCPLTCRWCHNPESQAMGLAPGKSSGKSSGKFPGTSPGQLVEILVKEIEKDRIFYDDSGGGVTFSGGEPLACPELLLPLIEACRDREIHTCLDTSGFAPFEILKAAAAKADLVLFDIKIIKDRDHLAFTGKPVSRILENLKALSTLKVNLKLRFPLIPNMTDRRENIGQIIDFLTRETRYRDIHILPFHTIAEGKYEMLKMKNELKHISPPTREHVDKVRQTFESAGFKTTIGG